MSDPLGHGGQPSVAVVVPVFNGERTVAACLSSLMRQSGPFHGPNIIVVDNNSTDRTREIVQSFPVTLATEPVQTSYAARNRGLSVATSDIVAFTDADCVSQADWLATLVACFEDPEVGAVAGVVVSQEEPTTIVERFFLDMSPFANLPEDGAPPRSLLTGNVAYRRTAILALGGFDEALFTGGDVDMGWRIRLQGRWRIAHAPDAIVHHTYRTTVRGLFRQYKRYGYSEVLLDTLYRSVPDFGRTAAEQAARMMNQVRALMVYALSACWRPLALLLGVHRSVDRTCHMLRPVLLIVADGGSLVGKLHALWDTRFMHRNPFPSREAIRREYAG